VDALGALDLRSRCHAKHPTVTSGHEGGEMLLFAVPIAAFARLADSGVTHWLLRGSIALTAGGLRSL
jgi:hypothetical protein